MKKIISLVVAMTLLFVSSTFAFASSDNSVTQYADVEIVEIDGLSVRYERSITKEGMRQTKIYENGALIPMILVFDEEAGIYYLDGEIVAWVENPIRVLENKSSRLSFRDIWIYYGSSSSHITWQPTVAAVLADIIKDYIHTGITVIDIIAKIGLNVLSAIASAAGEGDVDNDLYYAYGDGSMMYWYHWRFRKTGGSTYGYYNSYAQVY